MLQRRGGGGEMWLEWQEKAWSSVEDEKGEETVEEKGDELETNETGTDKGQHEIREGVWHE